MLSHGIDYIFISLRIVAVLRHDLGLNCERRRLGSILCRTLPFRVSRYRVITDFISEARKNVRSNTIDQNFRTCTRDSYPKILCITIERGLNPKGLQKKILEKFLFF